MIDETIRRHGMAVEVLNNESTDVKAVDIESETT